MKEKLLVLDDESLILISLEHLFEDDYQVFTTASVGMALRLAEQHDIAVILCDELMPGVSGHEFLRRVREISRATRVMMSGYADMTALTEAVNSGQIFAYIAKPWEPLKLKAQVAAAVSHFKLVQDVERERGLLRALMENIPDLIYFKDRESRFTCVNQAHARSLGAKDSAECVGKNDADYFEAEDALRWRLQEEEIVASGQPQIDRIERIEHPGGPLGWWSTTKVPMFDRGGHVSGIAGISRDITVLKNSEEARRKEAKLIRLLQSVTMAANRSSTIDQAGQMCVDHIRVHLGWPVGHLFLWTNDSEELALPRFAGPCLTRRVLASGKPEWIVNLTEEEPPSQRIHAAAEAGLWSGFAFPVIVHEKVIGILEFLSPGTVQPDQELLGILPNIDSQLGQVVIRQRAEQDLQRAKAAAESANRAKSVFLTTMSHEMRTPMNAILGMSDMLAESLLDEDQRGYVRVFQNAGANLLDLINNILDLSKVEAGHMELESIGFDIRVLLEKIVDMMVPRAGERGLHLGLEVLPGVPHGLVGDPNRVRQILINLIANALKFTEMGSVTLRVEPDPEGAPLWLRFNVMDTGIGIAAEKMDLIFDRFTQADSSTTRKYGGTGLGLAISRGLAELMRGRIGCTSEVGKGSTFFFAAPFDIWHEPVIGQPFQTGEAALPLVVPNGDKTVSPILIVEDSTLNVALFKAYLKDRNFEIDVAENGEIGVEKVKSGKPSLVVMDLQMPVMDGLAATRAIRQWEAETHAHPVPIIALTADALEEGVGSSLEAGCNEHLTKPVKKAILLEAIGRLIDGKIHITPAADIAGLVPAYLANVRRGMDEILAGVDSKDCTVARRVGHEFKGSGDGFGFPEISRAGAALEVAARSSNNVEIRSQLVALARYLDRLQIVGQVGKVGNLPHITAKSSIVVHFRSAE